MDQIPFTIEEFFQKEFENRYSEIDQKKISEEISATQEVSEAQMNQSLQVFTDMLTQFSV